MVEVAGVELFSVLTARKLLILRMARRAKKGPTAQSIVRLLYEKFVTFLVRHRSFLRTHYATHVQLQTEKNASRIVCQPHRVTGLTVGQ
jgi:hypothetical protein